METMRTRRWLSHALLGPMLAISLLGAACSSSGATSPSSSGGRLLPSSPTALPTFDLARFQRLLDQLKGKPVVVNVWASWCGPCVREAPSLAKVARTFQGRVQFLGVNMQDRRTAATAFIRKYGWRFPSVSDPSGTIRDGLGFVGIPVTQVLDASGEQMEVWSGPTFTAEDLARSLDKIVGT
jgi:thiol-disulfide isomerase/thioredoxin